MTSVKFLCWSHNKCGNSKKTCVIDPPVGTRDSNKIHFDLIHSELSLYIIQYIFDYLSRIYTSLLFIPYIYFISPNFDFLPHKNDFLSHYELLCHNVDVFYLDIKLLSNNYNLELIFLTILSHVDFLFHTFLISTFQSIIMTLVWYLWHEKQRSVTGQKKQLPALWWSVLIQDHERGQTDIDVSEGYQQM